jgi:hypothetical protein
VLSLEDLMIVDDHYKRLFHEQADSHYRMSRFMVRHLVRGDGMMPAEAAAQIFLKVTANYDELPVESSPMFRWMVQNARLAVEHERDESPLGLRGTAFDPGERLWLEHLAKDDDGEATAWGLPADWWKR